MVSLSCCSSCQPPSPNGPPLRPLEPSKSPRAMSKGDLPERGWLSISRLSSREEISGDQGIFEDKSDTDEEGHSLMVKSSSTLNAIKSKIRQRLSRDSATSKRKSRSVGTSEEEVERRRELKRLNHKRIQEELSNEGVYDDDAASLSTFTAIDNLRMDLTTPPQEKRNVLTPLIPTFSNGSDQPSRPGGPFEMVNSLHLSKRKSQALAIDTKQPPLTRELSLQRRHSSVELCRLRKPNLGSPGAPPQGQSPVRVVPPAPALRPQRLPSIADSASGKISWRLSFASERRSSQLRALIQEKNNSEIDADGSGNKSSPILWLWSQGVRSSSKAVLDTSENSNDLDASTSHPVFYSSTQDRDGADGNADAKLRPIHLQEMQISRRLASRELYSQSSSLQLSSCGDHGQHGGSSHTAEGLRDKDAKQFKIQQTAMKANVSSIQNKFCRDDASSLYSAGHKSMQSTSETSRFNLASLLSSEKSEIIDGSSDCGTPITVSITKSSQSIRPKTHTLTSRLISDSVGNHHPSTIVLASGRTDFYGRKTGLNLANDSFSKSDERHCLLTPTQSKFREEFDEPRTVPQNKSSILSAIQIPRLTKLVTRSYDGSSSVELQIPAHHVGYEHTNTGRISSVLRPQIWAVSAGHPKTSGTSFTQMLDESAEKLWSRALKKSQEERAQVISEQTHKSRELEKKKESRRSFISFRRLSWKLKGKGGAISPEENEMSLAPDEQDGALETSKQLEMQQEKELEDIEAWVSELRFREEEARAKSAVARGRTQRRVLSIPESWARFPSHTRSERNGIAGRSDGVVQQDFAIKNYNDGQIEWWTGERKHYHDHSHGKEHNSKLPAKLSKQLRASLYKLRTSKSSLTNDALHGRKSSISVGGILEYPELEIIAARDPEVGEWEEMEMEVAADLRLRERAARMIAITDGSQDGAGRLDLHLDETARINIADPKFYEDCLVTVQTAEAAEYDSKSEATVIVDRLEGPIKMGGRPTKAKSME